MSAEDRSRVEFCPCCLPSSDSPMGFEKIEDFKNLGLLIYHRASPDETENNDQMPEGLKSVTKSIIVQNLSDEAITSADLQRELKKKDMSCPRCRQIVELAHKLLQKVPALNKNVTMGICDRCRLIDPCRSCQENIKIFYKKYQAERAKNKRQLTEYQNNMMNLAAPSFSIPVFQDQSAMKRQIVDSEFRIDQLLKQEYAKAGRELNISDLVQDSQTLFLERKIPTVSIKSSKNLDYTPPDREIEAQMMSKQWLDLEHIAPDKKMPNKESIISHDIISSKSWSTIPNQKRSSNGDIDIFLKHDQYARYGHYKENELDHINYHSTKKQHKTLPGRKASDQMFDDILKTDLEDSATDDYSKLKTNFTQKLKPRRKTKKGFVYTFPRGIEKPNVPHQLKKSSELIKETHATLRTKTEEKIRQTEERRLREAEEKEVKRLAREEKTMFAKQKKIDVEKNKFARGESKLSNEKIALDKKVKNREQEQLYELDRGKKAKMKNSTYVEKKQLESDTVDLKIHDPKLRDYKSQQQASSRSKPGDTPSSDLADSKKTHALTEPYPKQKPDTKTKVGSDKLKEAVRQPDDSKRAIKDKEKGKSKEIKENKNIISKKEEEKFKSREDKGKTISQSHEKEKKENLKLGEEKETAPSTKKKSKESTKEDKDSKQGIKDTEKGQSKEMKDKTENKNIMSKKEEEKFKSREDKGKTISQSHEKETKEHLKLGEEKENTPSTKKKSKESTKKEKDSSKLEEDKSNAQSSKKDAKESAPPRQKAQKESNISKENKESSNSREEKGKGSTPAHVTKDSSKSKKEKRKESAQTTEKIVKETLTKQESSKSREDKGKDIAQSSEKKTKTNVLSKEEKKSAQSKEEKGKGSAPAQVSKDNSKSREEKSKEKALNDEKKAEEKHLKDLLNIQKEMEKSTKKRMDQDQGLNIKLSKTPQALKPKQEYEPDWSELLKNRNALKAKDASQLARFTNTVIVPATVAYDKTTKKNQALSKSKTHAHKFKMRQHSQDNKLLFKFKRGAMTPGYRYKGKSIRSLLEIHDAKHKVIKSPACPFCQNSDLELCDFEFKKPKIKTEYIKGQIIIDGSLAHHEPEMHDNIKPMLFYTRYRVPITEFQRKDQISSEKQSDSKLRSQSAASKSKIHHDKSGVTRFVLSDHSFIEKGWTMLPTEKVMRKMNVYRMRPAKPEFDWFKRNKDKHQMFYDSGEPLAQLEDDERCRWYYRNGRVALDYYNAEEMNAQQRFVIFSNGEPDERGKPRPYTILATFDYLGNGVVFDHGGKIRLKYNQTEGVLLDRNIGPVSHWKWHTLNDPPDLQQVMIDTQMSHKDPNIVELGQGDNHHGRSHHLHDNEDMVAIEFDNFVKEKTKKLKQSFKPFQIRMKALKINEHFSLKILDQASVYLIYRDGTTNIKLNIGMLLDNKEIIDTDTAEVGEVSNNLERFPARTDSLAKMQKTVAYARHLERSRTKHERRLRPPEPSASVDKMAAAASRPMRLPLRAASLASTMTDATKSYYNSRKPTSSNLYYSTE